MSYLPLRFSVRDDLFSAGDGAVVNHGCLIASPVLDVPIDGVVTHVQLPSDKPE